MIFMPVRVRVMVSQFYEVAVRHDGHGDASHALRNRVSCRAAEVGVLIFS